MEKKIIGGSFLLMIIVLVSLISFEKVVGSSGAAAVKGGGGDVDDEKMCVETWEAGCNVQGVGICMTACSNKYQSKLFNVYCEFHDNVSLCACVYRCTPST
ncbi:hypothetical protein ACP275_07G072200 [Erythranthe tilingii]